MFQVTKKNEQRVDIDVSGSLSSHAMREGLEQLIEAAQDVENGLMLYRISGFTMPTLGALTVELQKLPQLFLLIGRFRRCAVISDQGWIRSAAEIEGAAIPGLTIKSFSMEHADEAEDWLSEG